MTRSSPGVSNAQQLPFQILAYHAVEIEIYGSVEDCQSIQPISKMLQGDLVAMIDQVKTTAKAPCVTRKTEAAAGGRLQ